MKKRARKKARGVPFTASSSAVGVATRFAPGPDARRYAGKPRAVVEFTAALRLQPPEWLKDQLLELLASEHQPTRMAAWKEWARWSLGAAPTTVPDDDDDEVIDPKELQRLIERDVQRRALAGDHAAQLLLLRALDPKRYGGDGTPDLSDGGGPPSLNIVGIGEARAEHKPDAD